MENKKIDKMAIELYDLGDLSEVSYEEVASEIVNKLKEVGKYEPNLLYRGLRTTDDLFEKIKLTGTDRNDPDISQRMANFREEICSDFGGLSEDDLVKYFSVQNIFASKEDDLVAAIECTEDGPVHSYNIYAEEEGFPLVLVYDHNCLASIYSDLYSFEGPSLDALIAGFKFDDWLVEHLRD